MAAHFLWHSLRNIRRPAPGAEALPRTQQRSPCSLGGSHLLQALFSAFVPWSFPQAPFLLPAHGSVSVCLAKCSRPSRGSKPMADRKPSVCISGQHCTGQGAVGNRSSSPARRTRVGLWGTATQSLTQSLTHSLTHIDATPPQVPSLPRRLLAPMEVIPCTCPFSGFLGGACGPAPRPAATLFRGGG